MSWWSMPLYLYFQGQTPCCYVLEYAPIFILPGTDSMLLCVLCVWTPCCNVLEEYAPIFILPGTDSMLVCVWDRVSTFILSCWMNLVYVMVIYTFRLRLCIAWSWSMLLVESFWLTSSLRTTHGLLRARLGGLCAS